MRGLLSTPIRLIRGVPLPTFPPMFIWFRTHQRWLMLLITILVIVSFVWLFNAPQFEQAGERGVARVYGQTVTLTKIEKDARMLQLALALGLTDLATTLEGTNFTQAGAVDFVINSMIIRHEGRELGIVPTETQIKEGVEKLPVFQTSGQFDSNKYRTFLETVMAPRGFVAKHIDDIVRDSIILDEITKVIDAVPTVTDAEIAALNRAFEPATGVAVLFPRDDFRSKAKVTEEEIDAIYTVGAPNFMTPEWRTAKFVRFRLPEEARSLEGPARIEAQQKLADEAEKFSEAAATEGFEKAAAAAGYKVEITLPFDRQGTLRNLAGVQENLSSLSGPAVALAPTIFTLTENSPVSGVVTDGTDFLVAELDEVTPSSQLTLEEARPQIVEHLTNLAAQRLAEEAAGAAAEKIRKGLAGGKSVADLATEAGLKTESFTNVTPVDQNAPVEQRAMADATTSLRDGEVSGVVSTEDGAMVVWLEKRSPAAPEQLAEQRDQIANYLLSNKRSILFYEWLMWARDRAGVNFDDQQG